MSQNAFCTRPGSQTAHDSCRVYGERQRAFLNAWTELNFDPVRSCNRFSKVARGLTPTHAERPSDSSTYAPAAAVMNCRVNSGNERVESACDRVPIAIYLKFDSTPFASFKKLLRTIRATESLSDA
jgi:hypothetical protein